MTTSDTPPMSPEMQSQTPTPEGDTTTVSNNRGSGRRQWVEPAVVVAAITLAVIIFALLVAIVFGIYGINARMDALAADMSARIDAISNRMDVLSDRMDTLNTDLSARMDALAADLNSRMDTLSAGLNARIDNLYQLLFPQENLENIKNVPLQAPDLQS